MAQKEGPQKRVTISHPFYLGVHEVTQRQLTTLYPDHFSHFSARGAGKDKTPGTDADLLPADNVDIARAKEFCEVLSRREVTLNRLTPTTFRPRRNGNTPHGVVPNIDTNPATCPTNCTRWVEY